MDSVGWVPEGVDINTPNAARVYDYALGGYHNFEVDRQFKDQAELMWPGIGLLAHANRSYLKRVVRYLIGAGVRQFLDIGSGIPTVANVHEVAQAADPEARVVYVDIDPVAVAHARHILTGNRYAGVTHADLRQPEQILSDPTINRLLDFAEPVAILAIAVLHFIPDDDDPAGAIARLTDAVVAGSYLAISHGTFTDDALREQQEGVRKLYDRTPTSVTFRTVAQVQQFFAGWQIQPPGTVAITDWHPDPDEDEETPQPSVLASVGRLP
jgi:SAM-dependent methyltransferase